MRSGWNGAALVKIVDNLAASASAIAAVRSELKTRRLGAGEVIALHYMPSFTEADGMSVAGFVPGYVIVPSPWTGEDPTAGF